MGYEDHFSTVASGYREARPTYPASLFQYLANLSLDRQCVWDCATGNGQAALGLSAYFEQVYATDASANQIAQAASAANIRYAVATADQSGLPDLSCDVVTVAQALHWFDLPRFYQEVDRVLKPQGYLAVWCYGVQQLSDTGINAVVQDFYWRILGDYWPAERVHVENGYQQLAFPYAEIASPVCEMRHQWSLSQLMAYFSTWSAVSAYKRMHDDDPIVALTARLLPLWGREQETREIVWPITLKVGSKPA